MTRLFNICQPVYSHGPGIFYSHKKAQETQKSGPGTFVLYVPFLWLDRFLEAKPVWISFRLLSASYIVRSMRVLSFMEELLAIEAEAKYLLAAGDRSHEQTLMQELLRIFKEAELLFGPRDASYQLSVPRITECATSRTLILRPLRMTRIYLSRGSRIKPWVASLELAHEAIHVLSPVAFGWAPTILEEGLAECFAQRYVNRVHGLTFERGSNPKADAVMRAVSTLLARNEFVIKDLRTRQPVVSKIDEKLLVEGAGIELNLAKFLCTDFRSYWRTPSPWSKFAAQGAERVAACLRSIWDQ